MMTNTIDDQGEVYAQVLRKKVKCGRCKSSTFVLWSVSSLTQSGNKDRAVVTQKLTSNDLPELLEDKRIAYTVRCGFFRQNVPNPHRLLFCEGYKSA